MTSRIQFIFLELPNSLLTALKPGASVLQNICYALHMMEHLTEQPDGLKEEIFRLLFDSAEIANFTPEEKAKYEQNMTTERDIRNQISYARDLGREEGRAEGREEGREEGRKVGAREQSLLIARNLLQAGIPTEVVVRATGLSPEEVQG